MVLILFAFIQLYFVGFIASNIEINLQNRLLANSFDEMHHIPYPH